MHVPSIYLLISSLLLLISSAHVSPQPYSQCYSCPASFLSPTGCEPNDPPLIVNCSHPHPPHLQSGGLCVSIFLNDFTTSHFSSGAKGCVTPSISSSLTPHYYLPHNLLDCLNSSLNFPLNRTLNHCLAKRLSQQEFLAIRTSPKCQATLLFPPEDVRTQNPAIIELIVCLCSKNLCNSPYLLSNYLIEYLQPAPMSLENTETTRKPFKIDYHARTLSKREMYGENTATPSIRTGLPSQLTILTTMLIILPNHLLIIFPEQ